MRYVKGCEEESKKKTLDFRAKMKMGYDFKKAYATRRAWEFYNHPDVAGRCYVAVGGLDSITLFLFLRSIGINVPGVSVSMLEDRSIQVIHKALGVKGLLPVVNQETGRPWTKVKVIRNLAGRSCPKKRRRRSATCNTQPRKTPRCATQL